MPFIVAIDGPSGAGKGTITSYLAKKLKLMYLDTGATYRCVTLKFIKEKVNYKILEENADTKNADNKEIEEVRNKIEEILKNIDIEFTKDKIFLDGEDVTHTIREDEVNNAVSQVSHIIEVRKAMVNLQRKMSENKDVILEGRDIGTNVFPNADVKIYLDASVEERVKRRLKQNLEKGIESTKEEVRQNIIFRDNNDKNSKIGPLRQAEDAIYFDSSNLSIKEVEEQLYKMIKLKKKQAKSIEKAYITTPETLWKRMSRAVIKFVLSSLYRIFYRIEITGKENLEIDDGFIICANHVNYLDAAAIVLLNKKYIRFIAKADLFRFKSLAYLGRVFNIIPIKREKNDLASIKICLKALKNKEILGIFPEGTRKGLEKNVKVKNGAVFLASKARVKIVPAGINSTFKLFSKLKINFGKPIDITEFETEDNDWIEDASKYVMDQIVMLTKA